jgi:hypothetical protein
MHSAICTPLIALLLAVVPDTLVVCPQQFRQALQVWHSYRLSQGHTIEVIEPPDDADDLRRTICTVARSGHLETIVLIGDAPHPGSTTHSPGVPTNYITAHVNVRWGSEPQIATDVRYADTNEDGLPDVAVGRIPVDTAAELTRFIEKIIRFESNLTAGPTPQEIHVFAGVGGFGSMIDHVIESAAHQLATQFVPKDHQVHLLRADKNTPPQVMSTQMRNQFKRESEAWIYLGHGDRQALIAYATSAGAVPILTTADLARRPLEPGSRSTPLAILLACYAGAFDAQHDCFAEELLVQPGGPVGVLASTRVSMPYGNTVLGCELLRARFVDRSQTLGQWLLTAQTRMLGTPTEDPYRTALEQMATGLAPPPVDLVGECREHVAMYHLLGDPLTRIAGSSAENGNHPKVRIASEARSRKQQ